VQRKSFRKKLIEAKVRFNQDLADELKRMEFI